MKLSEFLLNPAKPLTGELAEQVQECSRADRDNDAVKGLSSMINRAGSSITLPWSRFAPPAMAKRDMVASVSPAGGFGVPTAIGDLAKALRPSNWMIQAGVTTIENLRINLSLPRLNAGSSATALPETGLAPVSSTTLGQNPLTPHRIAVQLNISKQLLAQCAVSSDLEDQLHADLAAAVGQELGRECLLGSGSGGSIFGLANYANVSGTPTFAFTTSANKFQDICSAEQLLINGFAVPGCWIVSQASFEKWRQQVKTGTSLPIVDYCDNKYRVGAIPVLWSQFLSPTFNGGDACICFDEKKLVLASWGSGISILSDPYSAAKSNEVVCTVGGYFDFAPRYSASLVISTNSGAN